MTTLMILGGGPMQLPAIETARRNGWRTVCVDGNPNAPGRRAADRFIHIDLKDAAAILDAARDLRKAEGLDGVFTAATDFSSSVAYVAENLGLPGILYETALDASDKARMRARFHERKVPAPRFFALHEDALELASDKIRTSGVRFPLVVKPADNMGARGVKRIDSEPDGSDSAGPLIEACRTAVAFSRSRTVVIEEFIEGKEYSIDAILEKGRLTVCGIADRHIRFDPFFIEIGHTLPADLGSTERDELVSVFSDGVAALGITDGAAKGDVFLGPDGAVVGEIAARLSGGYMSGWTYPFASGVNVTEHAMRIALGLPVGEVRESRAWCSAERAVISIPGTVKDVDGWAEARDVAHVHAVFARSDVDDVVTFPRNNVEKCGNVISAAENRTEAIGAAESGVSRVVYRLCPGDERTDAFLLGADEFVSFHAFESLLPETAAAITSLDSIVANDIRVIGFPDALRTDPARDWAYRTFSSVAERAQDLTGVTFSRNEKTGREFWLAVVKGGLQAALYLIDTINVGKGRELLRGLGSITW